MTDTVTLVIEYGTVRYHVITAAERAAGTTETTYTSHYATCPDAARYRKR